MITPQRCQALSAHSGAQCRQDGHYLVPVQPGRPETVLCATHYRVYKRHGHKNTSNRSLKLA